MQCGQELRTRFSPSKFIKLINKIVNGDSEKENVVQEIGFGRLLNLRCTKLCHSLCEWLISNYDPLSSVVKGERHTEAQGGLGLLCF